MTIYPDLPSGHTVFCDDIRYEAGGKISLMGIYNGSLEVKELPVTMAKLCLIVTLNEKRSSSGHRRIKVIQQDETTDGSEEDKVLIDMEYEIPDEVVSDETKEFSMRTQRLDLIASPFNIEQPSKIRVRSYQDGEEIALGRLEIKVAHSQESS